jgi:hypothetical protein
MTKEIETFFVQAEAAAKLHDEVHIVYVPSEEELKLRAAVSDLRGSTGPGGVSRKDFLLLCDFVERALKS